MRVGSVVSVEFGASQFRAWPEHDWLGMPLRIGEKIGRLIGADAYIDRECAAEKTRQCYDDRDVLTATRRCPGWGQPSQDTP